jgi:hypothetical protein
MFHSQKRENATIFKTPGTETTSAASIISQVKAKQGKASNHQNHEMLH